MAATMAPRRKRDPAYYREYRRRVKARKAREALKNRADSAPDVPTAINVDDVCNWIEGSLKVPTGPLAGRPFFVPTWQREWLAGACRDGVREAGMSISRKNGKSGIIAAWLAAHLVGPLNTPDWRGVVASMTGNLAKELRDAIEQTLFISGFESSIQVRKSPTPGSITGKLGAKVDFLAADKASGHALGADLALIDEAGLLAENKRGLWNALYTSISGRDGRFWCISIQGDGPMFAEMAEREGSPTVHFRRWQTPMDAALDDDSAWAAGNPALADGIKSAAYMRDAAARALASPSNEMHFRAWDLNQPVDPERQVIVTVRQYAECITPNPPPIEGDCVVGIDIGGSSSMTCAAALNVGTGAILVRGAFPSEPALSERARTDRMGSQYDRMVREGELKTYPGRVTPVAPFLADFFAELADLGGRPIAIGADRYRQAECQQAFEDVGLPFITVHWRGKGASATADGSHDVRAFQKLVLDRQLQTAGSTMLEAAIASSVLRFDGAGNPAIDKTGAMARIDALSAAVIAAGLRELQRGAPARQMTLHVI